MLIYSHKVVVLLQGIFCDEWKTNTCPEVTAPLHGHGHPMVEGKRKHEGEDEALVIHRTFNYADHSIESWYYPYEKPHRDLGLNVMAGNANIMFKVNYTDKIHNTVFPKVYKLNELGYCAITFKDVDANDIRIWSLPTKQSREEVVIL